MRRKAILPFITVFSILLFVCAGEVQAQCTYRVVNLRNDTVTHTIPCDFPVKVSTGDPVVDQNNFLAAFLTWNQNSETIKHMVLPTIRTTGIKEVFFEITASAFALFTEERKTAVTANPQLYKILP